MTIPPKISLSKVETKWYDYWTKNDYFNSTPDERESYTIVIPPPNITGVLHIGHILNNTIQDVLIRRARMLGKNACWVPGIDHASIATEAKVVAKLKEQGIQKKELTRDEFIEHAFNWKNKYGGIILEQLKKIGASCDWKRTAFTMDSNMSESVIKAFVNLYNKGLIYRDFRIVNWDPEAKTTLSNEEVIYEERQGKLYFIKYRIEGSKDSLTIATTRPETIFGDTAICINPNDKRFSHLKGKKAIVPICNRVVPIIEDEYVDVNFGTGCLKVTPAHDENDRTLGEKHNLEIIDIFNDDATLNSYGLHYKDKDRFATRKEIAKELKEKELLTKTEIYVNKVGTSERTREIVEPKLSKQWFLKMKSLVQPAINSVLDENPDIDFFPKKFKNTYRHWMENIRDWNISRQLWWGHQIPVFYFGNGNEDFVVAETIEKALVLAKEKTKNSTLTTKNLIQDKDTLDTWFSSWLWPISVFDGINNPKNKDFKYYYPTDVLVTGPDILFFWVARMIIAGFEFKNEKPFKGVYFTGLVRDKHRRKMSKSLGNYPDALKLIEDYGADGVRVGLLLSSSSGNDLIFDENLCKQGKSFANKIWNTFRLIKSWEINPNIRQTEAARIGLTWYENTFYKTLSEIESSYSKYRLSDVLMSVYKLIMDDFSSQLLEIVKPEYKQPIDKKTYDAVIDILENNLKILHPFMPFLTEEIWQHIAKRKVEDALIITKYPQQKKFDTTVITDFEFIANVVSNIRTIRKEKNIPFKNSIELFVINNKNVSKNFDVAIKKLTNTSAIKYVLKKVDGASFRVESNEYFVPISNTNIDAKAEKEKLSKELKRAENFLLSIQKKLSNERFINNAESKIVDLERKKEADAIAKIETIKISLKSY